MQVPFKVRSMMVDNWSVTNRLQLNNVKCKELRLCFATNPRNSCLTNVSLGGCSLELVTHARILGLTISCDLKWNVHVSNIMKKANKRVHFIVQLKRANVY